MGKRSWVKPYLDQNRPWHAVDALYAKSVKKREILDRIIPLEVQRRLEREASCRKKNAEESSSIPSTKRQRQERVTYKVELGYHGTSFEGFAWQKEKENTVEALMQDLIRPILKKQPIISCSGRTDLGVHAVGQCCSFYTWSHRRFADPSLLASELRRALEEANPDSLGVYGIERMPREFHATFSCHWRYYMYVLPPRTSSDGEIDRHGAAVTAEALERLLKPLQGRTLSYNAFARDTPKGKNVECVLHFAAVTEEDLGDGLESVLVIHLVGNRFLRRMVRVLVATLVKVAAETTGGSNETALLELARTEDRMLTEPSAPASGLCLARVGFSDWNGGAAYENVM